MLDDILCTFLVATHVEDSVEGEGAVLTDFGIIRVTAEIVSLFGSQLICTVLVLVLLVL